LTLSSEVTDTPRYRAWGDDRLQTWGRGRRAWHERRIGHQPWCFVDQSRTAIDLPLAPQSATLDLTQFGFNASVDKGPWTWGNRAGSQFWKDQFEPGYRFGISTAGYNARINGALSELRLLEHRPEPPGSESRAGICARHHWIVSRRSAVSKLRQDGFLADALIPIDPDHAAFFDRKRQSALL
jgi:hypothetical protein